MGTSLVRQDAGANRPVMGLIRADLERRSVMCGRRMFGTIEFAGEAPEFGRGIAAARSLIRGCSANRSCAAYDFDAGWHSGSD